MGDPLLSDIDVPLLEREIGGVADTQSFIEGLSELELSLLICAARVETKYESDTFNFNVVYDEYVKMAKEFRKERTAALSNPETGQSGGGYRIWSRDVARAAWERLENMELVTYVEAGSNGTGTVFVTSSSSSSSSTGGSTGTSGGNEEGGGGKSTTTTTTSSSSNTTSSSNETTAIHSKPPIGSTKGAIISDDIRMAKVDASLTEIAQIIGHDHVLRKWTRL